MRFPLKASSERRDLPVARGGQCEPFRSSYSSAPENGTSPVVWATAVDSVTCPGTRRRSRAASLFLAVRRPQRRNSIGRQGHAAAWETSLGRGAGRAAGR